MTSGPYQVMPDLSAEETLALRQSIAENGVLVAVVRDEFGATIDGHHREVIAADLGVDCPVETRAGMTDEEKRALAYELNSHRRQLDFAKRRSMVSHSLKLDPHLSDRQHAARLHVDHKTVALARRSLVRTGELPQLDALVGKDGKARPAGRPSIGESPQCPPGVDEDTGEIVGQQDATATAPPSATDEDSAPSSVAEPAPDGASSPDGEEDPTGESASPVGSENEKVDKPPPDPLTRVFQARKLLNKALTLLDPTDAVPLMDAETRLSFAGTWAAVQDKTDQWCDALEAVPGLTLIEGAAS